MIDDFYEYKQSVNRYTVAYLLLTDPVANSIRRELKKLKPGIKVDFEEIKNIGIVRFWTIISIWILDQFEFR